MNLILLDPLTINTVGLIFDIGGAVLLWKFGLPADIRRSGSRYLLLEGEDEKEKGKAVLYDKWGRIGLILLIVGFLLQALSNFL